MRYLELLAPARNIEIGIAAIDCGADAVYIAGPGFGARKAAGNSLEDISQLCSYAHRFGVRIFMTTNTIVYEDELPTVHEMMLKAQDAGVDAFIIQDLALTRWDDIQVPLHASTQCAIRTPEKAAFLKSAGFSRLVLERQLSLEEIKAINQEVGGTSHCELECFVHGALCVCYSGQCYLSEKIAGRSANRGECIQACRSLYDLEDEDGKVLERNKPLLSLKDLNLIDRLPELSDAGVCSFKIEGRLKNASYVKNIVRSYSMALDKLIAEHPESYSRSSFGKVSGGFVPAPEKTFNRGYTELFLDGKKGQWASGDAANSLGERVGVIKTVKSIDRNNVQLLIKPAKPGLVLNNGDGYSVPGKGGVTGFRADICEGMSIICKNTPGIRQGSEIFRNINASFEKELDKRLCKREINVSLYVHIHGDFNIDVSAVSEDGREVFSPFKCDLDTAENKERAESLIREQLSKRSEEFIFRLDTLIIDTPGGKLPLVSAATLNSIRRLVASDLSSLPCKTIPLQTIKREKMMAFPESKDYKTNVSNSISMYSVYGTETCSKDSFPAYELNHQRDAELMRTKYCIRFELGMCPVHHGVKANKDLFLVNNGKRFSLQFDCGKCEMTVKEISF